MPLTEKGKKTRKAMQKHYGKKKGDEVFYAMENKMKGMKKKGYAGGGMTNPRGYNDKGMETAQKKANAKARKGMATAKPMNYAKGGLVKSTGKLKTGIAGCGHKGGK